VSRVVAAGTGRTFTNDTSQIVPRESSRFGLPGDRENIVKLDADHGDICRFDTSEHDQDNYELVRGKHEGYIQERVENW